MSSIKIAGKNSSDEVTAVAVNDSGEIEIQRQWKSEEVTILSAVSITSTDAGWSDRIDVSGYATYSLRVYNSLDQDVTIVFGVDTGSNNTTYLKNYGGSNLGFTIPADSGYRLISPEEFPFLQYLQYVRIRYQCSTAPTSGSLTVKLVGKY